VRHAIAATRPTVMVRSVPALSLSPAKVETQKLLRAVVSKAELKTKSAAV
jgi:hypothetical protein